MNNRIKFTDFSDSHYNIYKNKLRMKKSFIQDILSKYVVTLVLVFAGFSASAQNCFPQMTLTDGTTGTIGTFCEGQLISFDANSPGFTTTILWDFGLTPAGSATSNVSKPTYSYVTSGTYTVTFTGTGPAGTCTKTLTVNISPSPDIHLFRENDSTQCFENNSFCFKDTSKAPGGLIVRQTYVFSNGLRIDSLNPAFPIEFCVSITDPTGGFFDLVIESEDSSGCVSKVTFTDYLFVHPKLGIEFLNLTPPPNPGCDSTLGVYQNISLVSLAQVDSFTWLFGDGLRIDGNSTVNTQWWTGVANDGIIEHMYRSHGTFDGSLVATAYGCTDTFTFKAAVANIVMNPNILSTPNPACTPDNPIDFSVANLPATPGVDAFLWNFGDPPAGPANVNDKSLTPNKAYGPGPWMISLRLIAGPCDVTIYDTVQIIGPGSTIEVPFNRVAQDEAYQCEIRDSVQFVNNSSFYQNDWNRLDEDSSIYYYDYTFDREFDNSNGTYKFYFRTWQEKPRGNSKINEETFADGVTLTRQGYTVSWDATKDSLKVIFGGVTTYHKISYLTSPTASGTSYRFGVNPRKRFVFNYIPPVGSGGVGTGDQTAVDPTINIRDYRPNIFRIWDMGDQFAPQCTTDSRPWVSKNVGINCNFRVDSIPIHWYTPWDEVYRTMQDGRNYTTPMVETRLFKPDTFCYPVNVYPANPMIVPADTILTVPIDSAYTYMGVTIPAFVNYPYGKLGNWIVKRPPSKFCGTDFYWDAALDTFVAANIVTDTTYHNEDWLGRNNPLAGNGSTKWTVTYHEMEFDIPAGVTMTTVMLPPPPGGAGGGGGGPGRTITGPATVTLDPNEQFKLSPNDCITVNISVEETTPDTTYATPSNYPVQVVKFGLLVTETRSQVFVDSAAHRSKWFLDNAGCFNVTLYQEDTIHPLNCKATGTKSLALTPPSADGLEWTSGFPCPYTNGFFQYVLEFDIADTKPGCTQQWFEVNYDTLAFPPALSSSWNVYNGGGVKAPDGALGTPIPFGLPYDLVGNTGTTFVKEYSKFDIGDPYQRTPFGSFTLGLIVGNGPPNPLGGPPECMDTSYYPDLFRILPLAPEFEILLPVADGLGRHFMCAGGTAYFKMDQELQDSIKTLRWAWGYQGIGRGPNLAVYVEEFEYYQPYTGPVAGRNDENYTYNGEDWLYNYVVRRELSDITGNQILDTIVTLIIKDWQIIANTRNANTLVVDAFDQLLGLRYADIPPEDVPYYLGDGTVGCLDTTGLSQFFTFGVRPWHQKIDSSVWQTGNKRYRGTLYNPQFIKDTTYARDGSGAVIKSQVNPAQDSISRVDSMPNTNRADVVDFIEVAEVLHFRDSSLQGYDTLLQDTSGNGQLDTITGVWKYTYRYPEIITPNECDPTIKDTIYRAGNGPMVPSLFLNSTVGCEARSARLLNVGFLNDYSLKNENICQGLRLDVDYYQRYYQYGEEDPFTYPIKVFPFWQDFDRYTNNKETYTLDWDSTDGVWDDYRSIEPNNIYTDPGTYTITIVSKDSVDCRDTTFLTVYVSKLHPGFRLDDTIVNCASIVNFFDTSFVDDPCADKDTCSNGVDLSCESIIRWEWDFGDSTRKSILQNPSHNYTSGGSFDVTLKVWSELGCIEEITQTLFIPGPQPQFEFDLNVWNLNDSAIICAGDSVLLINTGKGDVNTPTFQMDWGDGTFTAPSAIGDKYSHTYYTPGTYELYLTQEDLIPGTSQRCSRIFPDTNPDIANQRKIIVIVRPLPPVEILASDTFVCVDEVITFTADTLDPRYTRMKWYLEPNDSISRTLPDNSITYSWSKGGVYEVVVAPEYDIIPRCWDRDTILITVDDVKANFTIDSSAKPIFCFTNTSTGANPDKYRWTFEPTLEEKLEVNPCFNWNDEVGTFEVCLYVVSTSEAECPDDTCQLITNTFSRKITFYNVFTPNGDGQNDEFIIDGTSIEEFEMKIFNRWGERVFETTDVNTTWNGKVNNTGISCPEGTYFYIVNYKFLFSEENEGLGPVEGQIELIRNQ